ISSAVVFAVSGLVVIGCSAGPRNADSSGADSVTCKSGCSQSGPAIIAHFDTPSSAGLQPVIDAINGARSSIRMAMFHLTVPPVVDALAAAARRRVDVQIIIDQGNWSSHTPKSLKNTLADAGVKVTPSSPRFRITHEKSFVVDESTAYIMSL